MAAPRISGTAGLMLAACPGMLPEQLRCALVHTSQRLSGEPVTAQGAGLINTQKAVAYTAKAKHHADESANLVLPVAFTAGRP